MGTLVYEQLFLFVVYVACTKKKLLIFEQSSKQSGVLSFPKTIKSIKLKLYRECRWGKGLFLMISWTIVLQFKLVEFTWSYFFYFPLDIRFFMQSVSTLEIKTKLLLLDTVYRTFLNTWPHHTNLNNQYNTIFLFFFNMRARHIFFQKKWKNWEISTSNAVKF